MTDLIPEKTQPDGFNFTAVIASLTCQSGSHLTLFASICAPPQPQMSPTGPWFRKSSVLPKKPLH